MKMIKKTAAVILLASLLLTASSCGDKTKILESSKEEKSVVMTVDGHEVPMELYRYVALQYKASYGADNPDVWLGESGAALLAELNENTDKSIIRLYTTISMCEDYGISPDDAFIRDAVNISMDEIYESYGYDYEAYADSLAAYNMNDSVYRFIVRNDILAEELLAKMIEKGEVPSTEEQIRTIFSTDELIRVKQILVNDPTLTAEENLRLAEEAYSRAMAGENFDTLVNQYGDDWQMFNNTDGYYITRGSYTAEFEDTAFSLGINELSGIVETGAGYSIILRLEKDAQYIDSHFETLADEYLKGLYNIALEKHEMTLTLEKTEKLDDYTIFNMTMNND